MPYKVIELKDCTAEETEEELKKFRNRKQHSLLTLKRFLASAIDLPKEILGFLLRMENISRQKELCKLSMNFILENKPCMFFLQCFFFGK